MAGIGVVRFLDAALRNRRRLVRVGVAVIAMATVSLPATVGASPGRMTSGTAQAGDKVKWGQGQSGGPVRRAAATALALPGNPTGRIAYSVPPASDRNTIGELWTADPDGGALRKLVSDADGGAIAPDWSPQGNQLAFHSWGTSSNPSGLGIYTVTSSGGGLRRLSQDDGSCDQVASWSPNGSQIAFEHAGPADDDFGCDGTWSVWAMDADGSDRHHVVDNARNPAWGPSGDEIAFVGPDGIYTVPAEGGIPHPVIEIGGTLSGPQWSPDGTMIAFTRYFAGAWKVWVADVTTGDASPFADGLSPTWSEDGSLIAYQSANFQPMAKAVDGSFSGALSLPSRGWVRDMDWGSTDTNLVLAERFRPNLRFDSAETYRPLEVFKFFEEQDEEGNPAHQACWEGDEETEPGCTGIDSPDQLWFGDWLDIAGDGGPGDYHSPDPGCTSNGMRDCDTGRASAIYYWEAAGYVDYWMFYRFNDWPFVTPGDHEGDWENVSVAPSLENPETFDYASFSQHGHWYGYLRENLSCDGGGPGSCGSQSSHIDVFVSEGSHANYADECDNSCPRNDTTLVIDGDRNGDAPWGNNSLASALIQFPAPSQPSSWSAWPGRWGVDGPSGPAHGTNGEHFNNPWRFECARDNENCPGGQTPAGAARTTRADGRCAGWFGAGVQAVACSPARVRAAIAARRLNGRGQYRFKLAPRASRNSQGSSAAVPGLAQALGDPLRPGESIVLRGNLPRGTRILVRSATEHQDLAARFEVARRGLRRVRILARERRGRPRLVGLVKGTRRLRPVSTRRAARLPGRARVRSLARRGNTVRVAYTAPGSRARIELSATRTGPALDEEFVRARARRLVVRIPQRARYLRITGTRRSGTHSRTLAVRIPRPTR